jgi:hypothetical protein
MQYLAIFLIVYGAFLLASFLFQFPFLYRMGKVKVMVKMMGKTGFNILLIVMGVALIVIGVLLL